MKYVIGKTNMPGSAGVIAKYLNRDGHGEIYFLDDVPMHKVNTFLRHLLKQVKDKTYLLIVVGVASDKLVEVAGIEEDHQIYQWSGN
ncbi:MAG: hypothetical protein OXI63_02070 [Candidatus Poribacteria bacterium]|nr:hypothetical protein [Candidatus Poribacteria bacterium]